MGFSPIINILQINLKAIEGNIATGFSLWTKKELKHSMGFSPIINILQINLKAIEGNIATGFTLWTKKELNIQWALAQ